jgi:multidrug efflux pump subunit AcrA (membrane-fusion protein)
MKLILKKILKNKKLTAVITIVLILAVYFGYKTFFGTKDTIRYITAAAEKGTLIVSVTGSGQISALNQVDLKSKTSGDIIYLGIKNGQEVRAGMLLAQIDTRDAQKAIRDAEIALQSAQLELEKMKGLTTDEGSIRGIKEKARSDLQKAYDDGFNNVSNAFLDFPDIIAGLYNVLFDTTLDKVQWNIDYYAGAVKTYDEKALQYRNDVSAKYQEARKEYDQAFSDYKSTSRYSDNATIDNLVNETYETTKTIAEAIKSANNLIQFYKDKLTEKNVKPNSLADTHLASLNSYTSKTNSYLLSLLSVKNTIQTDKENLVGTDFDISDQKIKVSQAENTLTEAKENLDNCYIRVPFDGIVAKVNVKKGDSASSGAALATLITKQKIAEITLNEVDVAKIKVGQKATITFDAIEGLSITGEVAEIDSLGTVSQGVVTYVVKIIFDTQDERVKSGMSVSVTIITEVKQDVLLVPNAAVKSNNEQYVEVLENNVLRNQTVEIGLSNDTMTEIKNGLKENDQVVTQTITATTKTTTQTTSTGVRIPGVGGFGR